MPTRDFLLYNNEDFAPVLTVFPAVDGNKAGQTFWFEGDLYVYARTNQFDGVPLGTPVSVDKLLEDRLSTAETDIQSILVGVQSELMELGFTLDQANTMVEYLATNKQSNLKLSDTSEDPTSGTLLNGNGTPLDSITIPEVIISLIGTTGAVRLPTGTTAQRPAAPIAGMIRFNTDTNLIEFYNGTIWV